MIIHLDYNFESPRKTYFTFELLLSYSVLEPKLFYLFYLSDNLSVRKLLAITTVNGKLSIVLL